MLMISHIETKVGTKMISNFCPREPFDFLAFSVA